ncbi:sigma factor-like helix-turn-helix DNA-binding protein [Sphingobium sp. H39-3-25]|uniref:sigma factor-like helix-turn-helix DNA-binding protein n=1 Tax=Sphingobium arseniciresistens TaxID=3030834 RepID=UPI0023B89B45|nr:sigma factor-like helix-turn-helix DNA-binding protein [Sphingobium arseniciresistens]
MHNSQIVSLLHDLRAHLLGRTWLRSRHKAAPLLRRLDAVADQLSGVRHPAIAVARARLEGAPVLRIDIDEAHVEETPQGVWVRGWIWVEQQALRSCDAMQEAKFRSALADLPQQSRVIYLAHCIEGLTYPAIAAKLDLDVADVQHELAAALLALSIALDET